MPVKSCDRMTLHQLSKGLFCIGLVEAGLLPLESMRSEQVQSQAWKHLHSRSQMHSAVAAQPCYLQTHHLRQNPPTINIK